MLGTEKYIEHKLYLAVKSNSVNDVPGRSYTETWRIASSTFEDFSDIKLHTRNVFLVADAEEESLLYKTMCGGQLQRLNVGMNFVVMIASQLERKSWIVETEHVPS